MLSNNNERLNIVKQLKNKFDYKEFVVKCTELSVTPLHPMVYAQKLGILSCSEVMYPELSSSDAYLLFIEENPYNPISAKQNQPVPNQLGATVIGQRADCGTCGGGKVR